jgi:hypothetical protein
MIGADGARVVATSTLPGVLVTATAGTNTRTGTGGTHVADTDRAIWRGAMGAGAAVSRLTRPTTTDAIAIAGCAIRQRGTTAAAAAMAGIAKSTVRHADRPEAASWADLAGAIALAGPAIRAAPGVAGTTAVHLADLARFSTWQSGHCWLRHTGFCVHIAALAGGASGTAPASRAGDGLATVVRHVPAPARADLLHRAGRTGSGGLTRAFVA